MEGEAAGGIVLMAAAAAALIVANSPARPLVFSRRWRPISAPERRTLINDALMAVFFLLVGLEIKPSSSTASFDLVAPYPAGVSAAGGMMVPALIYVAFKLRPSHFETLGGWAIPTATDIAFCSACWRCSAAACPVSLKVFLTALAIIDDPGAVVIIGLLHQRHLARPSPGAAAGAGGADRPQPLRRAEALAYLLLGALLWFCVLKAGVHATIAGVALAMTILLRMKPGHQRRHRGLAAAFGWSTRCTALVPHHRAGLRFR